MKTFWFIWNAVVICVFHLMLDLSTNTFGGLMVINQIAYGVVNCLTEDKKDGKD